MLALGIGGGLALIVARIATPGRAVLEQLIILPLYVTPLLTAITWSWLGLPQGGIVNRVAGGARSAAAGQSAFRVGHHLRGRAGVCAGRLPADRRLAADHGSGPGGLRPDSRRHRARGLIRITLPLVLPAALGAAL